MDIKFEKDGDQPDKTRVVKNGEIVGFYLQQGISWQLCDLSSNFLLLRLAGVGGISEGAFRKLIIKRLKDNDNDEATRGHAQQ